MLNTNPSVAIIILNYNGVGYLEKFLPSVMATSYSNYTIIVADNASTDSSIQFLKINYPSIQIILLPKNLGYAGGYNEALKRVEATYYVLLNSDVAVQANWLQPMVALLNSNPTIAACQPKILSFNEPSYFEYAGAAGGYIDSLGYPFARGRVFDVCEQDEGQYNENVPIFWASGAALFIKASIFHAVGGFDSSFFAHQEEIDLCWRLQNSGYLIYACNTCAVYHVGGGTLPKGSRKLYLNFRNSLVMMAKNLVFSQAIYKIPLRLLLDIVFAYKSLLGGDFSSYKAVAKAHLHWFKWFFITKKNLQPLQKKTMHHLQGYYAGVLVWDYFIKKKKTFKEIVPTK